MSVLRKLYIHLLRTEITTLSRIKKKKLLTFFFQNSSRKIEDENSVLFPFPKLIFKKYKQKKKKKLFILKVLMITKKLIKE